MASILFIGWSDSRLLPCLLTGTGPGEVFTVRNLGAFVPPHNNSADVHGTAAPIEFALLKLLVGRIIGCGHSHRCGIRALYGLATPGASNLQAWLELGREATLPVRMTPEALCRTEQRAVVPSLERLIGYPRARQRVGAGHMTLHGWHGAIKDGEMHVCGGRSARFVPALLAQHSDKGLFAHGPVDSGEAGIPGAAGQIS